MTNEQINIAIAESLGWKRRTTESWEYEWMNPDTMWSESEPPNYTSDLNAMHEAEKVLTEIQCAFYRQNLREITTEMPASRYVWHATARQRAGAYLRTIGKWIE